MVSDWLIRLRALLRPTAVERELDDELRFHLEAQTKKYVEAGMAPDGAARRARLEFGALEATREECREARGVALVDALARDVRHTVRSVGRSPATALTVVGTLALCIGANTVAFSVVDAVLLQPLTYAGRGRGVRGVAEIRRVDGAVGARGDPASDSHRW